MVLKADQEELTKWVKGWYDEYSLFDGRWLRLILDNDILPPFGYVNFRPAIHFKMGGTLLFAKGKVGNTYITKPDMLIGEDAANHTMRGSFIIYQKPVVKGRSFIVKHDDSYIKDYISGCGVNAWDPLSATLPTDYNDMLNEIRMPDVYCTLRPINHVWQQQTYDVTGEYHPIRDADDVENDRIRYPSMRKTCDRWQWAHHSDISARSTAWKYQEVKNTARFNTECGQGLQWLYCHSDKDKRRVVIENSHLGQEVGPGIRRVWKGLTFEPPSFNYAQMNKITIAY
jgi:hypothetical protein